MKDYDENKESSYLKYSNVNNLYGLEMPQKWPVYYFKWVEEISEFNEDFIKDITMIDDAQYPKKLPNLHNDLPFLLEKMKI